jgi:hypothetical protein
MDKGFKCLDLSTGRIYISCDVIFYEQFFPFVALHSTAGPRYHSDALLLPSAESGNNTFANPTNSPASTFVPLVSPPLQLQDYPSEHADVQSPQSQRDVPVPDAIDVGSSPALGAGPSTTPLDSSSAPSVGLYMFQRRHLPRTLLH